MNKTKMRLGAVLLLGTMLGACTQTVDLKGKTEEGQGLLSFTLKTSADFATTRAVVESTYANVDNYTIVVTDNYGVERMNCKGSEVTSKMPLILNVGDYTVKAYYGAEASASRDTFYVYGESQGYILPDEEEIVEVECTPTCGRIRVEFDEKMDTFFCEYKVKFEGTKALKNDTIPCVWEKNDSLPWYVKLDEGGETISYTVTTETKEEYVNANQKQKSEAKGTFQLNRNKGYKLNISPSYSATGKVGITITVDESTNDKNVDVEVPIEWT